MKNLTQEQQALIFTAKGDKRQLFYSLQQWILYKSKDGKIYINQWVSKRNLKSVAYDLRKICAVFNIEILEEGNDAPRGGAEGQFIKVSEKNFKKLISL